MFFFSAILVGIVNVAQKIDEVGSLADIQVLFLKPWITFEDGPVLSTLYYIAVPLSFICAIIYFDVTRKITEIDKNRETGTELRQMLKPILISQPMEKWQGIFDKALEKIKQEHAS